MKADRALLEIVLVDVARKRFGPRHFERGRFLAEVEQVLKERGLWEKQDDEVDPFAESAKSRGQKNIDFCFSDLAKERKLVAYDRNNWGLAPELMKDVLDF